MKQFLVIWLVLVFGNAIAFSQSKDSLIKNSEIKYQNIRANLESYELIQINSNDESIEGSSGMAYFDADDLKFITVGWYGETGKRIVEYYFDANKLFFANDQLFEYNAPIYLDEKTAKEEGFEHYFDPDKTTSTNFMYYFENDSLILWLDNEKKAIDLNLESSKEKEIDLLSHSKTMQEKFKR